jgi:hypothetical protein
MRRHVRVTGLIAGLVLSVSACSAGEAKRREDQGLTPTFAPESTLGVTSSSTTTASVRTDAPEAGSTTPTATGPPDAPARTEVAVTDAAGDATPSPVDPPPAWADVLGARLIRSEAGFELRVRLGGGDAPESTPDDDHTMNVASFYDIDGDGAIDYEIWANVASVGWGSTYYDNGPGRGGFGEGAGVTVKTEGDEVVLRFPLTHLADAARFRWSVASEWGRYEALGTPAMVRDDVPDDDGAAAFPGS